ncbi:hypothetical protein CgunFtcFv8_008907 [Champsocephalus gunnari]|uniref:Uncharacterized protein n=1 Tax=Champsocephalus gunnari TaxID=52237 RepID=A0AAN8HGH5_CHAGU|nr:hypothetical protein CgunFtcFv8_008907 [Champsocephalus gunnari]
MNRKRSVPSAPLDQGRRAEEIRANQGPAKGCWGGSPGEKGGGRERGDACKDVVVFRRRGERESVCAWRKEEGKDKGKERRGVGEEEGRV